MSLRTFFARNRPPRPAGPTAKPVPRPDDGSAVKKLVSEVLAGHAALSVGPVQTSKEQLPRLRAGAPAMPQVAASAAAGQDALGPGSTSVHVHVTRAVALDIGQESVPFLETMWTVDQSRLLRQRDARLEASETCRHGWANPEPLYQELMQRAPDLCARLEREALQVVRDHVPTLTGEFVQQPGIEQLLAAVDHHRQRPVGDDRPLAPVIPIKRGLRLVKPPEVDR